ncbi:MAG: DUF4159 domain-containing protein, partial [Planctomycetales bacterium]|nr:DUF4159 domain-containing protein [Planctomycetales bacterium]
MTSSGGGPNRPTLSARRWIAIVCLCGISLGFAPPARGEISEKKVLESIQRAKRYITSLQQADGSWRSGDHEIGVTSLTLLALINAGLTPQDRPVELGLKYLRTVAEPTKTYEVSLMIMALAAAKDDRRDNAKILSLVKKLEQSQIKDGPGAGCWNYETVLGAGLGPGDRSNGQFAVLGLREAQDAGVPAGIDTWQRARNHWLSTQNVDGSWSYSGPRGGSGSGSMTVAGISSLVITEPMVRNEKEGLNPNGTPNCCANLEPDDAVERACRWLGKNFSVGHNPGAGTWLLYYLYGLERAGRLSGRRFFGEGANKHDWYREGAEFLVETQDVATGGWRGEGEPLRSTAFALLFLSKGIAPVLMNKLQFGPRDPSGQHSNGTDWNRHPHDVRNLTHLVSNLPKWPKLLSWQVVDIASVSHVTDLMQAPVLFISGTERPVFQPKDVQVLKEYVTQGGFIFAQSCCQKGGFDTGFRELVQQMFPPGEAQFKQLEADHPVFRSEYLLADAAVELWGVDVGCRTPIIYSPYDHSCLWERWTPRDVPGRSPQLTGMITKSTRVGVNVLAYATGREPASKLRQIELLADDKDNDQIERGFLEIAKLRHTGGWDAAPQALRHLLVALNQTVGLAASTKPKDVLLTDPTLNHYPLLYIHGRSDFQWSQTERTRLRDHLKRGVVLFGDACCGAPLFDIAFRREIAEVFPDHKLQRIPPDHGLFLLSKHGGYDLKQVQRREFEV